ncbi:MAG: GntR family transcriptional regulator [Gammaproteobacteria bacterium]|nr:GntR family transcriptional regulator [Gammaproteobacteria bacterium]
MTTTPKSGAGVSRYLRLYRVLSQALAEGRFAGGTPLPSEPRLMRDYGISRSTVRRALARLEAEGRIERKRGSGTFARDRGRDAAAPRDLSPLLDSMAGPPAAASSRTITLQHMPTPAFLLGERSGFGATTLLIRQIRYIQREPVVFETAYLPEEIGKGLTQRRLDADRGAILSVLAAFGHRSATIEREFAALEADPLAADSLGLAVGAPVFNVRTLARDPQHRTMAYVNCLYRPDRYEAHAAIEIGGSKRHRAKNRN